MMRLRTVPPGPRGVNTFDPEVLVSYGLLHGKRNTPLCYSARHFVYVTC